MLMLIVININMRCIEMKLVVDNRLGRKLININMRCIEICLMNM